MKVEEILIRYREMSAAYHTTPDKKQALVVYNMAYESLLEASEMKREEFGYLLANGELPAAPESTE